MNRKAEIIGYEKKWMEITDAQKGILSTNIEYRLSERVGEWGFAKKILTRSHITYMISVNK